MVDTTMDGLTWLRKQVEEADTDPGPGTPGPARSIWPSRSCGRVATSPTGCSSLAGAPSGPSSRSSASPTSEASRRVGSRAWCGSSGSRGSPRAGSPRWPRSSIIRSRPSGCVRWTGDAPSPQQIDVDLGGADQHIRVSCVSQLKGAVSTSRSQRTKDENPGQQPGDSSIWSPALVRDFAAEPHGRSPA